MAFGRRTAGTGTGAGYGSTAPAGYGTAGGVGTRRRGWRGIGRRRNAGAAIAQNKIAGGPKTKLTDMRAASGRRLSVAGAVIGEKMAHLGADIRLGFYTISHPVHPLRRAAARESAMNTKAAATERKRQKIARASDVESRKRATVRENRAARLNTAL